MFVTVKFVVDSSLDRVVDIVFRLQARQSVVRIPAEARYLYLVQNVQTASGNHPASYSRGTRVIAWS